MCIKGAGRGYSYGARLPAEAFSTGAEGDDAALAGGAASLKITPQVTSLLDYSRRFGHTGLATV